MVDKSAVIQQINIKNVTKGNKVIKINLVVWKIGIVLQNVTKNGKNYSPYYVLI